MSNYNNLVINVIQARGLHPKHHHSHSPDDDKPLQLYVSLTTAGKGSWKSKVSTNPVDLHTEGVCLWREHCEFQLTEMDSSIHLHVNHKNIFGLTETVGQLVLEIGRMQRYMPPTWLSLLANKDSGKERGQIQLEYQFDKKMMDTSQSTSTFSLNKIEKERAFDKLKKKMALLGKNKKSNVAAPDTASLASISMSRHSSITSMTSGLAFSSPSPNQMMLTGPENHLPSAIEPVPQQQAKGRSGRNSLASSSGIGSSGGGTLNESTSPHHLLNVIKHLQKELVSKENRIRDLEEYTDRLLSKIILTHPELLLSSPPQQQSGDRERGSPFRR